MGQKVRLLKNSLGQVVRLPAAYRFDDCDEVFIRRDPETGDLILSRRPDNWDSFMEARQAGDIPTDLLKPEERQQAAQDRDPFERMD